MTANVVYVCSITCGIVTIFGLKMVQNMQNSQGYYFPNFTTFRNQILQLYIDPYYYFQLYRSILYYFSAIQIHTILLSTIQIHTILFFNYIDPYYTTFNYIDPYYYFQLYRSILLLSTILIHTTTFNYIDPGADW